MHTFAATSDAQIVSESTQRHQRCGKGLPTPAQGVPLSWDVRDEDPDRIARCHLLEAFVRDIDNEHDVIHAVGQPWLDGLGEDDRTLVIESEC